MHVSVEIVNAFVDGKTGGNPAGVVLDANNLTTNQRLKIAQEVGLSETAFVLESEIATIKLEFFTPERQIAHCKVDLRLTDGTISSLMAGGKGRSTVVMKIEV